MTDEVWPMPAREEFPPIKLSDDKVVRITSRSPGYAHVTLHGTYEGPVTVKDIEDRFYHSYFGGRSAWARDGKWGCVVHTD